VTWRSRAVTMPRACWLPVTEKILNHLSGSFGGIVGVYQRHAYAEETRAALEAWGNLLDQIATRT